VDSCRGQTNSQSVNSQTGQPANRTTYRVGICGLVSSWATNSTNHI